MQDQATKLRELVTQEQPSHGAERNRPRRVVVAGAKGGVGTSTIALNLAVSAQYQGQRVLLIDADPVRGDLATICDLAADFGLEDVLQSRRDWSSVMVVGPAGISLVSRVGDFTSDPQPGVPQASQLTRKLDSGLAGFDLIVIDAGGWVPNGETCPQSDELLLVMTPDHVALKNAYRILKERASEQKSLPTVVVNQVRDQQTANDAIARLSKSCDRFLGTTLSTLPMIAEHELLHSTLGPSRPVACVDPNASAARTLAQIAKQTCTKA